MKDIMFEDASLHNEAGDLVSDEAGILNVLCRLLSAFQQIISDKCKCSDHPGHGIAENDRVDRR